MYVVCGMVGLLAALLALQATPHLGLALLAACVGLLVLANLRIALFLIIPAIALSPEMPILGVAVRIEDLLMVPMAAGWLIRVLVRGERQKTPVDRLLLAYLAVGVVATLWGGYLGTARFFTTDQLYSAPFHLLKRLEFVLLFFILTDTLTTTADARKMTYILIVSLLGLSAFGLSQFLSNRFLSLAPTGAPVHEPGVASMLSVALALGLFQTARLPARLLLGSIIVFSIVVLPLSLGRNFIAATVLIALYVGVFQQRWVLASLPVAWVIGRYFYPYHVVERVLTFRHVFEADIGGTQAQGAALLFRTQAPAYYSSLVVSYSPLLGLGLASLPLGFIDSEYAIQFFYTGLVGLCIFVLLGARLLALARKAKAAATGPQTAALAGSLQLALMAYAVYSVFSASVSAARLGGLFFIVAGLTTVVHRAVHTAGIEASQAEPRSPHIGAGENV